MKKALVVLIVLVIVGAVGWLVFGFFNRSAVVTIDNQSGKQIEEVTVTYEGGSTKVGTVAPGAMKICKFSPKSECLCTISIKFEGRKKLLSRAEVVGPGYKAVETIAPKGIRGDVTSPMF